MTRRSLGCQTFESPRGEIGDVWPSLMVVAFGVLWVRLTTGRMGLVDLILLSALTASIVVWGRVISSLASIGRTATFPLVLLLGTAFHGTVISLVRWFVGWPIVPLFVVLLLMGLAIGMFWERRGIGTSSGMGLLATFLSLSASTAWLQHYFPPIVGDGDEVVVKPIRDVFIHAHQVTLLAYPGTMSELGRYGLADEPVPFYHYASYVFPAIFNSAGVLTAFESTMAIWLPLGLTLVGLAAFVLGECWFGPRGGIWSLVGLLVLPDPSYWTGGLVPIGTYSYSFHRFLQIAPANAYAIAMAAAGLALLSASYRHQSPSTLGWGLVLSASSLLFKAQIFLAAFPLALLVALGVVLARWGSLIARWLSTRWGVAVGLLGVGFIVALAVVLPSTHLWERTPAIRWEWPPGDRLAEFLLVRTLDDPPAAALARRSVDLDGLGGVTLRVLLVFFMAFRWWLILLVPVAAAAIYSQRIRPIHGVALAAMLIYLSYAMLLAPNITGHPFGNPWDLQFVPFCWAYLVVVVWLIGTTRDGLAHLFYGCWRLPIEWSVIALLIPIYIGRGDTDDWQTDQRWSYMRLDGSLLECTDYIRSHASPTDRIQDSMIDPLYVVEALCERRAYVGWPVVGSYTTRDPADEIFQRRQREVHDWLGESTVDEVVRFARDRQIHWLLVHPESELHWPASLLSRPAFQKGSYRVYDLNRLTE